MDFETTALSIGLIINTAINASVWYRLGQVSNRVKECENFKVTPKGC